MARIMLAQHEFLKVWSRYAVLPSADDIDASMLFARVQSM